MLADEIAFSEIFRNVALGIAAFVGAYLAWRQLSPANMQARSANTQAELARRTHVMELFNRAAGQLGDARLEVRLAAIYTLAGIARDFADFANPVFELVQAYLRATQIDYGDDQPPVDVQAIMNLLRARLEFPRA